MSQLDILLQQSSSIYKKDSDDVHNQILDFSCNPNQKFNEYLKSKSDLVCQYCGLVNSDKYGLSKHIRRRHEQNLPFKCSQCPKAFVIKSELTTHILTHSELKTFSCNICLKSFRSRTGRNRHILQVHEVEKFHCELCSKTFLRATDLKTHKKKIHSADSDVYKCPKCSKKFIDKDSLDSHEKWHQANTDPPKICNISKNKKNCKKYLEKVELSQCFVCNQNFTSKKEVLEHLSTTHPKEAFPFLSFKCNKCDYVGPSKNALRSHSFVHLTEKKNMCHLCAYASVRRIDLKRHLQIHSKDKNFVCEICGGKFVNQIRLKVHKALHSDKIIPCKICGKKFSCKKQMMSHLKNVHFAVSKLCELCGKTLSTLQALTLHKRRFHQQGPIDKMFETLEMQTTSIMRKMKVGISHMPKNKTNDFSIYECFACGEQFLSSAKLEIHTKGYHFLESIVMEENSNRSDDCETQIDNNINIESSPSKLYLQHSDELSHLNQSINNGYTIKNSKYNLKCYKENFFIKEKCKISKKDKEKKNILPSESFLSIDGKRYLCIDALDSSDLRYIEKYLKDKEERVF